MSAVFSVEHPLNGMLKMCCLIDVSFSGISNEHLRFSFLCERFKIHYIVC